MNERDRFDKFTEQAKKVFSLAREEAQRLQHNYIGTEHLLLGLVREEKGIAANVLHQLGIELHAVRDAVEFIIGRGDRIVLGEIGLTPRAKQMIEYAVDEARQMNHHYIGTEHLLLGLLREGQGIAAGVLETLGVKLEQARSATLAVLGVSSKETVQEIRQEEAGSLEIPDQDRVISLGPLQEEDDRLPESSEGNTDRFNKFTARARRVMESAQEEAHHFQHNYIGTEHLLLGLIREERGTAAQVLLNLGVERVKVRSAVEYIIGSGTRIVLGETGLTPRSKKVLELAVDEARRMDHHYIGTEHLLLGLVREGEGIAAGVLESMGVNLEKARRQTIRLLGHE
jgi:ATP-dependent Clp protease ATP-binding subunit ClpA